MPGNNHAPGSARQLQLARACDSLIAAGKPGDALDAAMAELVGLARAGDPDPRELYTAGGLIGMTLTATLAQLESRVAAIEAQA